MHLDSDDEKGEKKVLLRLKSRIVEAGADPGFLARRFKFTKGVDLKIVPDYLISYAVFSEIPHENGIILSKRWGGG